MGLQPNSSNKTMVALKGPLTIAHLLVTCTALSRASCLGQTAEMDALRSGGEESHSSSQCRRTANLTLIAGSEPKG